MVRTILCSVIGLCLFCIPAIATEQNVAPGSVVLNTGPTDCGLDLIGSESCPPIDLVPCTTRCEIKRLADPNDPLDSDEWSCWNSDQENWQSQAIEPTNNPAAVNKFSVDPLGGGKQLKPPANAAPKVVCANFFECNCTMIAFGSYSCSKGPASGTSYLLSLVRSTDPCLTQIVNPPVVP